MNSDFDSMIFDLDGTLWDAVASITRLWNDSVRREADVTALFSEEQIRSVMGLTTVEIGNVLFPYLSPSRQRELMEQCCDAEKRLLPSIGGKLYPKVPETLNQLKEKLPLFIVSNCDCGYIEAFLSYHSLADKFSAFLCYGDTGEVKAKNIRTLIKNERLKKPVYIGDTHKDRCSAAEANIPFLHAAYGFGQREEGVPALSCFADLLNYI